MRHEFTVYGNQEGQLENPVPYHRATQGSKWSPASQRYIKWQCHVVAALKASKPPMKLFANPKNNHPINGKPHGYIRAHIFFGKENHGDPDNIVKGISDALFECDKHIDVYTHHTCGNVQPKVRVVINLDD